MAVATLTVVVVLPTPPLRLAIAIILGIYLTPLSFLILVMTKTTPSSLTSLGTIRQSNDHSLRASEISSEYFLPLGNTNGLRTGKLAGIF